MNYLLIAAVCYLAGSIPFGLLVGRLNGIDIREHGSKNIGATNVLRVLGKGWGYLTFGLDFFKGYGASIWAMGLAGDAGGILGAVLCVIGHNFPVWLRFKGGKGIATSAGVLVALVPFTGVSSFFLWVVVFLTTRYVSVGSIAAAVSLPIFTWISMLCGWVAGWELLAFSSVLCVLGIWRHRANIARLMEGTEPRFQKKSRVAAGSVAAVNEATPTAPQ